MKLAFEIPTIEHMRRALYVPIRFSCVAFRVNRLGHDRAAARTHVAVGSAIVNCLGSMVNQHSPVFVEHFGI